MFRVVEPPGLRPLFLRFVMDDNATTQTLRLDRAMLSDREAAAFLGVGKTTLWSMLSTGELGPQPVKIRSLTKWNRRELLAWLDAEMPNADRWRPMWRQIRGVG